MSHSNDLSQFIFLFAHGAGADMNSGWMVDFDKRVSAKGLEVRRFNFPYMNQRIKDGSKRPPDRAPKLIEAFKAELDKLPKEKKIIIGGKSMGGRMASLLVTEPNYSKEISAVVCLGFPFHPPKKLDKFKGDHLGSIQTPLLILQGQRDTMGTESEISTFSLSKSVKVRFLPDGDHSFKPRVKSGFTLEENLDSAAQSVIDFINSL